MWAYPSSFIVAIYMESLFCLFLFPKGDARGLFPGAIRPRKNVVLPTFIVTIYIERLVCLFLFPKGDARGTIPSPPIFHHEGNTCLMSAFSLILHYM